MVADRFARQVSSLFLSRGVHQRVGRVERVAEEAEPARGPVVRARLENGPLEGETIVVDLVEARPPKTIEVSDEQGGATYRYCLSEWTQKGETAVYTFLYPV